MTTLRNTSSTINGRGISDFYNPQIVESYIESQQHKQEMGEFLDSLPSYELPVEYRMSYSIPTYWAFDSFQE